MTRRGNIGLLFLVVVTGAWLSGVLYLNIKAADELDQYVRDVRATALWEATREATGDVRLSVLDACNDLPSKVTRFRHTWTASKEQIRDLESLCPLALRGLLRSYGELGGAHGCAQVRRTLAIYQNLGDEASLVAASKCIQQKGAP